MPAPAAPVNGPGVHGKNGIIAITVGAGTPAAVGNISDYSLDMTRDTVEITSLQDANKRYVAGLKDLSGSFSAWFASADDAIFDAAESETGCTIEIWPDAAGEQSWKGPALLDASIKGGATAAVSIDATFKATGAWTRTPAAVGP